MHYQFESLTKNRVIIAIQSYFRNRRVPFGYWADSDSVPGMDFFQIFGSDSLQNCRFRFGYPVLGYLSPTLILWPWNIYITETFFNYRNTKWRWYFQSFTFKTRTNQYSNWKYYFPWRTSPILWWSLLKKRSNIVIINIMKFKKKTTKYVFKFWRNN